MKGQGPITRDVETLRRTMLADVLDELAPKFPEPTREELHALIEDPSSFFAKRRAEIWAWARWFMNAPDWYMQKYSFGLGEKRKLFELVFKQAHPAKLEVALTDSRELSGAELLGMLAYFGASSRDYTPAPAFPTTSQPGPSLIEPETQPVAVAAAPVLDTPPAPVPARAADGHDQRGQGAPRPPGRGTGWPSSPPKKNSKSRPRRSASATAVPSSVDRSLTRVAPDGKASVARGAGSRRAAGRGKARRGGAKAREGHSPASAVERDQRPVSRGRR